MTTSVRIAPSQLSADFARLGEEVTAVTMFAHAGAGIISFHPEASEHIDRSLQLIRSLGVRAGLVLNPATPLHCLDHGGVKADNAERIGSAGADSLVAGSAIFNGGGYQRAIHTIRTNASAGRHARVSLQ